MDLFAPASMREGPAHLCHHKRDFLEGPKYDTCTYFDHSYYDILAYTTDPRRQPCSSKSSGIMSLEAIVQQVLFPSSTGRSMTIWACSSRTSSAGYNSVPLYGSSFTYILPIFRLSSASIRKVISNSSSCGSSSKFLFWKRANPAHGFNVSFTTLQSRLQVR